MMAEITIEEQRQADLQTSLKGLPEMDVQQEEELDELSNSLNMRLNQ